MFLMINSLAGAGVRWVVLAYRYLATQKDTNPNIENKLLDTDPDLEETHYSFRQ